MIIRRAKSEPGLAVSLSEAPFAFWEKLFPEQPNVFLAPSRLIADQLSGTRQRPGYSIAILAAEEASQLPGMIEVDRSKGTARICVGRMTGPAVPTWSAPLFPSGLGTWQSRWQQSNPLQPFLAGKTDDLASDGREFFTWAVRCVGDELLQRLQRLLREGKLIAAARVANDPLADLRDVPPDHFDYNRLDLARSHVTRDYRPLLTGVRVREAIELPADKSGGQSFAQSDAPLIEEMHVLINSGKAKSVTDAARQVAHKAKGLGQDQSSVIKRLRTRYGRTYPTRPRPLSKSR